MPVYVYYLTSNVFVLKKKKREKKKRETLKGFVDRMYVTEWSFDSAKSFHGIFHARLVKQISTFFVQNVFRIRKYSVIRKTEFG